MGCKRWYRFHTWGQWYDAGHAEKHGFFDVGKREPVKGMVALLIYQERQCTDCGQKETRTRKFGLA